MRQTRYGQQKFHVVLWLDSRVCFQSQVVKSMISVAKLQPDEEHDQFNASHKEPLYPQLITSNTSLVAPLRHDFNFQLAQDDEVFRYSRLAIRREGAQLLPNEIEHSVATHPYVFSCNNGRHIAEYIHSSLQTQHWFDDLLNSGTHVTGDQQWFTSYSAQSPQQHSTSPTKVGPEDMNIMSLHILRSNAQPLGTCKSNTMIGTVHRNTGEKTEYWMCCLHGCEQKTFGRAFELKRHHRDFHGAGKKFFCDDSNCKRGEAKKSEPFFRKDKLADHKRSYHGNNRRRA